MVLFQLNLSGTEYAFGALVCYEDMFPALVRDTVQAGAEILYVATNNAWYGEEGGAYFHAAHSVLRAIENRRPVIRCGNAGWSGWIDAYGSVRDVLTDEVNSIYFKGCGSFTLTLDKQWHSCTSFTIAMEIGLFGYLHYLQYPPHCFEKSEYTRFSFN